MDREEGNEQQKAQKEHCRILRPLGRLWRWARKKLGKKEDELPPTLHEDIIEAVAEKMLFTKPYKNGRMLSEIDFTHPQQNPYRIFSGLNRIYFNAMTYQFTKLKRIEFSGYGRQGPRISLYRDKVAEYLRGRGDGLNRNDNTTDADNAFTGPYRVTKRMVSGLIDFGKLRVTHVQTEYFLDNTQPVSTIAADGRQKTPVQVFASLFLANNGISEEIAQSSELKLEHLAVSELSAVIEAHVVSVLALDSVEVELESLPGRRDFHSFFSCPNQSNVRANRTKRLSVRFYVDIAPETPVADINAFFATFATKWCQQSRFLIQSCPSLEVLEFHLDVFFLDGSVPAHILPHIRAFLNVVRELLGQLNGGGEQLRVSVKFMNMCENRHIVQMLTAMDNSSNAEQQMFTLGEPFEGGVGIRIARSLTITDTAGRPHLCKLLVFSS